MGAHPARLPGHIEPANARRAATGLQNGAEEAQAGGLPRAINAEQPEDPPWLTLEAHRVHRPDFAALLVPKDLGKFAGLDHAGFWTSVQRIA